MDQPVEDLEALFDQIVAARDADASVAAAPVVMAAVAAGRAGEPDDIFQRVGQLTRDLHDALKQLGYDKNVDAVVDQLPDARARLAYIANLTGQAAEKALSKAEAGAAIQQRIDADARALSAKWDDLFAGRLEIAGFKPHAVATHAFLRELPVRTSEASALFTDIMLAQDFHDLTGQVINKIVGLTQDIEDQLVKLLLDVSPPKNRTRVEATRLNGPVIDQRRADVVTSQGQVDDLLASLGF